MEHILKEKANSFELSDKYKVMMDDMLEKHKKDELKYISENEFRKLTAQESNINKASSCYQL